MEQELTMYELSLLHSKVDRSLRFVVTKVLENHKLTMMEWLLLATVCREQENNKGLSMSEIAHTLDVTLPQITALTAGLINNKLAKQKVSASDKRSRRLTCTTQGKKLIEEIDQDLTAIKDNWLDGITSADRDVYINVVKHLANRKQETN